MSADLLGFLAAGIVLTAGGVWVQRMRAVRMPADRTLLLMPFGLGAVLGAVALGQGTGWPGGIAAGVAVGLGAMMVGLRFMSAQEAKESAIEVGGPILDFSATDSEGQPFELASLRGRPLLIKFFRGHW